MSSAEISGVTTATGGFRHALPFWSVYLIPPLVVWVAFTGGWAILLIPLLSWHVATLLDVLLGRSREALDPEMSGTALSWHTLVVRLWMPVQLVTMVVVIAIVPSTEAFSAIEKIGIFFGLGVMTGTVGITFAHELMHRPTRIDRWLADILMASVLYSHFRSEHLIVHHTYVGTPRDATTAKYNEGFYRYFARMLCTGPVSASRAEAALLARKNLPAASLRNPFWVYAALQVAFLAFALVVGGWAGLALFAVQAFTAIWQLELTNYVEHYGLTRKHLGDGRYEPVQPHHSWNATHRATNWLLINLQRHSDHHAKPARPFPLLQPHTPQTAPELPFGYPLMTAAALLPPLWRRIMNPRVRSWRKAHYPDVTDWADYSAHATPMPR